MKILWVNNIAIPKIAKNIGEKAVPVGGWMVKLANEIAIRNDVKLQIMFPYHRTVSGKIDDIEYTSFVESRNDKDGLIKDILKRYAPDVIHIFGTENPHSYVVAKACEELGLIDKVVISIQGLASVCAEHYTAYLPEYVVKGRTLRDVIKGNVLRCQKDFAELGIYEVKALQLVKHVIGRTDWDSATTAFINSDIKYHFNNEMLRESFYNNKWRLSDCKKHSIFFSQATYPIKGLHLMLDALVLLKRRYPDVSLSIAGKSYTEKNSLKLSYYEKYIIKKIKENGLESNVTFTGFLNEQEMCQKYLESHVFVSASSIENSPNSVCEAMILGVPVVSSLVGGITNLISHGIDGFYYQADASYMLAYYVDKIFKNNKLALYFSENARKAAMERHETKKIIADLIEIYREIKGEM